MFFFFFSTDLYGPIAFTIMLTAVAFGSYGYNISPYYHEPHVPRKRMPYSRVATSPFPWKDSEKSLFDIGPADAPIEEDEDEDHETHH